LNVAKPLNKLPLSQRSAGCININQEPNCIIVDRSKLNRSSIGILEDKFTSNKRALPNDKRATRCSNGGQKLKTIKGRGRKLADKR
jgi:hypothetical protein